MSSTWDIKDTSQVVHLDTEANGACPEHGAFDHSESFASRINHVLGHGYKLLYVGQESKMAGDGSRFAVTAAVLGKPK